MSVVLLDADGVFVDFVTGYLGLIERVTGKRYTHDQITDFDIGKALGLTPDDAAAVAALVVPGFCRALQPLPGAVDGVKRLREIADVYVVTSPWNRCPTWTSEREAWIAEHLGIHHSHVLHGSAKHLVDGAVFVDDKTSTVVAWQLAHKHSTAVLWASPWNRTDEFAGYRFNNWNSLARLVEANS